MTCEICEREVSTAELDAANVCQVCFAQGLETIRREEDKRASWVAEQLNFGRAVGWL